MTTTTFQPAQSVASSLAYYTGKMSNWINILPPKSQAQAAFDALPADVRAELTDRAARHGMEAVDLMQKVPGTLWGEPDHLSQWLELVDVSHIKAVSTHPHLADDPSNVIWELRGTNRARGAAEMTGAEFSEGTHEAAEVARDLTGDTAWWSLNDVFKGCLEVAGQLAYSVAWLPKDKWLEMMQAIQRDLPKIDKEKTFAGKFKLAKAFAKKIVGQFKQNGHHIATAFMLGCLTMWWAPAGFFVATWGLTGVLGVSIHLLRKLSGRYKFLRFLKAFNMQLEHFEYACKRFRNFLDSIKNNIYNIAKGAVDLFFGAIKAVWKAVQPHVARVIEKAKDLVKGFLNWLGGCLDTLMGRKRLAYA